MAIAPTAANALLDYLLGGTPYPTMYLALFTSAPTGDTGGTEVTGGAYARVAITFDTASGAQKKNATALTYALATAAWGTISHCAVYDHITTSTAGHRICTATLGTARSIGTGDKLVFTDELLLIGAA